MKLFFQKKPDYELADMKYWDIADLLLKNYCFYFIGTGIKIHLRKMGDNEDGEKEFDSVGFEATNYES